MKKFAKMSLVAAIAVAGTVASAQPLAEAIKNVDVSGTAVYRYDERDREDHGNGATTNFNSNSYKIAVNLSSKINDDLKFNTRSIIGNGDTNMQGLNTEGSDSEAYYALTQFNFAYTGIANTTVIAGKQAVPSPFAVQADAAGDEDTGTGISAIVNAGPVTVAGVYLNQTNLEAISGQDVAGLGIMGSIGPVALDGWYLKILETGDDDNGHAAYTVGAKAKIEMVSLYGRYSAIKHDADFDTEKLWKVGAKAKFGIVGFGVDYGQTNDVDNTTGNLTGASLTGDADAVTSMQGWALNLEGQDDADLLKLNVNVQVLPSLNLSANYNILDIDSSDTKNKEYYGQGTFKMGKNFMTYVRLGKVLNDGSDNDQTRGRVHVQYSF